jgi:outer membrane usher protein
MSSCPRRLYVEIALLFLVSLVSLPSTVHATTTQEPYQLQLELYINGGSTHMIGSFVRLPDGRFASTRGDLADFGIKVPGAGAGDERINLDDLAGVSYRYDEATQRIFFTVGDEQRSRQTYDIHGGSALNPPAPADFGSVVNYTLFAASTKAFDTGGVAFSGANASLDGRVFGPYGTVSQSGIVGSTTTRSVDVLRLDTTYTFSKPQELLIYRAGDTINGGLAWTRPIRMGGLQMQRDFGLRPDLVTLPLPAISGSAAVPSTLDVYVDNMRVHSQEVPAGPYQITNIPVLSGVGTARVVMQDAAGRQIETSLPFYASAKLLKEGLNDFSAETGLPRLSYGVLSNSYAPNLVASATLRSGVFDWLTVEGHAEGGAGLRNAGVGTVTRLGQAGVLSVANSGSQVDHALGLQPFAAFDTQVFDVDLHFSAQHTFGNYNDLASVTARQIPTLTFVPGVTTVGLAPLSLLTSTRPPKAIDTALISLPPPFDASRINLGYVHQTFGDGTRSDLASVSYSRLLFHDVSVYGTAFSDLHAKKNSGVFIGLSLPLGGSSSVPRLFGSTSVSATPNGTNVTSDLVKPLQPEPDSYGVRIQDSEGATPFRSVSAAYRAPVAQFDTLVQQFAGNVSASVQAQGSVVAMSGGVFLANRIDDAFAVVNVGAPEVGVLYENRPVGKTDANGQILIPDLRSYQANKVAIDARDLPVDADAPVTQNIAVPADRSGIRVDFGVVTEVKAAVVVLNGKDGKFIAPGLHGRLESGGEAFIVGYDGRAYIKGLDAKNTVVVDLGASECRASFPFASQKNTQVVIGPVVCQ